MALHFARDEYEARMARVQADMAERKLDALLLFSQESMYWLTGYDTFGFVFFQCLVVKRDGRMSLITRSADLRQARHTSIIEEILVWTDRAGVDPTRALKDHLFELDLLGAHIGVELDTHGLTARNGQRLDDQLRRFGTLHDASDLVPALRAIKSPAEIAIVREAARLGDAAWRAGVDMAAPGVDEGAILAAMQGSVLAGGGDYPGNEFVIGSGEDALLCRYKSGRRALSADDQMTIEIAGVWRHYHAAMMDTVVIGTPRPRQHELFDAAEAALARVVAAMRPGNTFGEVFEAHAQELNDRDMQAHKLNACGYSLGATFTPSWMDPPMFYSGNEAAVEPNMVLFAHMILMDSESRTAMTLGRTYLTTDADAEPLSAIAPAFVAR
ncbi:Xaa-Pro peptidase family protein [Acuticoccus sp. MNP-M23]|uniref:M24 family metallopeptidase n=1 Tax=Acuticoccus sp. MNP-M23 TaxID=3072793 RepID=UPI0028166A6E|nr:Xaa-Pro peptidase family protein [Acuticoccus sp. MNP-M23]WMS43878.1 Xaa-Pro peptidase family protein [Acuticoccus sp. MNP-M23]